MKTKQSNVYSNTIKILKSYRDLVKHVEETSKIINISEQGTDYIELSKKTANTTKATLKLIETFLEKYMTECKLEGKLKKYDVIRLKYINDNMTNEQLAEILELDVSTINKYHKKAINELSVMFFGIEGLRLK